MTTYVIQQRLAPTADGRRLLAAMGWESDRATWVDVAEVGNRATAERLAADYGDADSPCRVLGLVE